MAGPGRRSSDPRQAMVSVSSSHIPGRVGGMSRPYCKVGVNVGARRSGRVHEGDGGLRGLLRGHRPPARQQPERFLA